MTKDFTFDKYLEFCRILSSTDIQILTILDYARKSFDSSKRYLILRHDIDKRPNNALLFSKIEKFFSLEATYHFRNKKDVFQEKIVKKINSLGHEIGYHYESLTEANGDYSEAIRIFEDNLSRFRRLCNISTISMHGSSLSIYNNRDIWKKYSFEDYGIIAEAQESINWKDLEYYTDAGGSWNSLANIRDKPPFVDSNNKRISSTDELISHLRTSKSNFYLNIHPDRWNNGISWYYEFIEKKIINIAKIVFVRHIQRRK